MAGYSLALLPRDAVASVAATWWLLAMLGFLAWQAVIVWLLTRLMGNQAPRGEPPSRRARS